MATNFRPFNDAERRATTQLNANDLSVGDTLVKADWSYSPARWSESVWTVVKVLKTRLVVERELNGRTIQLRLLLDAGRYWAAEAGLVLNKIEGQSKWSTDEYYLFTPDEPLLASLRDKMAADAAQTRTKVDARNAATTFTQSQTVEHATAAIAALQAFIDIQN